MLTTSEAQSYERSSNCRAGYCVSCNKELHPLEIFACETCCMEFMSDPNSTMWDEDNG